MVGFCLYLVLALSLYVTAKPGVMTSSEVL